MKKIIAGTLVGCVLFTSGVFASDVSVTNMVPTLYNSKIISTDIEETKVEISNPFKDLMKKYELVIRNNNLQSDYKYNSVNYYTSKLDSEDLIVPKEIMDTAKEIYFLVEEGSNRIFYANDSIMAKEEVEYDEVKKEYNYRKVDYKEGQSEYVFNNKDLVKDFGEGNYRNVTITLMAEFSDEDKIPLSNTAYLSMSTKENVLSNLKNKEENRDYYFGYYNSNDLESYLEKYSETLTRSEYKNILTKAEKKVKSSMNKNENIKKTILNSISKESDFKNYVDKYSIYTETSRLFSSLGSAVKNQLQNIRAFDAIDSILK